MKTSKIYLILSIIGLLGLTGCGSSKKPLHRSRPLNALRPTMNFEGKESHIKLSVRKLSKKDCIKLFGMAGRRLVSKTRHPLAPLHITITNDSDNTYILNPDNIDLRLVDDHTVSNRLKPNVSLKTIGTVVGGAALAGLVAATGAGLLIAGATFASAPLIVSGVTTCVSSAAIFLIGTPIASAVRGVKTVNMRKAISKDIENKTLLHDIKIAPNQTVDALVFTRLRHLKKDFNITLENTTLHKDAITFHVRMKK